MSGTGGLVFSIAGLLALVAFLPWLASRLRVPNVVLLAALGCGLGIAISLLSRVDFGFLPQPMLDFLGQLASLEINADLFLWVFLPILLFETALAIDGRALLEDSGAVLTLAVVAVILTTAVGGLAVAALAPVSVVACLLVASIIATTDPVAVVAIFREVGAPQRLTNLVEGESLLNDAAAIAIFTSLLGLVASGGPAPVGEIVRLFLFEFVGGAVLGALMGRLAATLVSRLDQGGPAEVTLSVALAYLTYALAQHYAHVSGVVAVVLAGIIFGTIGRSRIARPAWRSVRTIWGQIGFWASSLIFVLASMLVPATLLEATAFDGLLLVALLVGAAAARILCLFGIMPLLSLVGAQRPVDYRYNLVIVWGGLRGAVTLALALAVVQDPAVPADISHLVSVLATGFVLFTLLVQATTLRSLISWLGLDQLEPVERVLRARALALSQGEILDRLSQAAVAYGVDLDAADEVRELYRRRLDSLSEGGEFGEDMLRQQLIVALATITSRESELYVDEFGRQLVSRTAATTLVRTTGDLLDALRAGGVTSYRQTAKAQNGFDRTTRVAAWLHRRLGLARPLAAKLARRLELLLVRRRVLESLIAFSGGRIRALFGERVAETAQHVLEARLEGVDRAVDAMRLQYPDYWKTVSGRYLSRAAVRLELDAYQRMRSERLLSPQILRNLMQTLRYRLETFEAIPRLDLGLDHQAMIAQVPLLREIGPEPAARLSRLLRPRLALPGERILQRGDPGNAMYFIASGAVEVDLEPEPVRLGTGEFFGEIALLRRQPRSADVRALGYCQLLELRRDAFRALLKDNPQAMKRVRRIAEERLRAPLDMRAFAEA